VDNPWDAELVSIPFFAPPTGFGGDNAGPGICGASRIPAVHQHRLEPVPQALIGGGVSDDASTDHDDIRNQVSWPSGEFAK